jgi:hypothetical protein
MTRPPTARKRPCSISPPILIHTASPRHRPLSCARCLLSCSSVCHQLDSWSVFAYPKQRATVLVGSVLKWRARPQCLPRQKSVFAYTKQRATLSVGSVLKWRARPQCLRWRRDFVLQMNNTYIIRWYIYTVWVGVFFGFFERSEEIAKQFRNFRAVASSKVFEFACKISHLEWILV